MRPRANALFVSFLLLTGLFDALPAEGPGASESGIASWYGYPYHGRHAANGEIYDMEQMTAAHKTLPFNTWVEVRNTRNQKTVRVRITDRGPFIDGRVIDLSRAAARSIDMLEAGITPVEVAIVERAASALPDRFAVQVGAFRIRENAERLCEQMRLRYGAAKIVMREGDPVLWRVLAGGEPTQAAAWKVARDLRNESGGGAFVVRVDEN